MEDKRIIMYKHVFMEEELAKMAKDIDRLIVEEKEYKTEIAGLNLKKKKAESDYLDLSEARSRGYEFRKEECTYSWTADGMHREWYNGDGEMVYMEHKADVPEEERQKSLFGTLEDKAAAE